MFFARWLGEIEPAPFIMAFVINRTTLLLVAPSSAGLQMVSFTTLLIGICRMVLRQGFRPYIRRDQGKNDSNVHSIN